MRCGSSAPRIRVLTRTRSPSSTPVRRGRGVDIGVGSRPDFLTLPRELEQTS